MDMTKDKISRHLVLKNYFLTYEFRCFYYKSFTFYVKFMAPILKAIASFFIIFFAVGLAIANNKGEGTSRFIYENLMSVDNQNIFQYIGKFIYEISLLFFIVFIIILSINFMCYKQNKDTI